MQKGKHLKGKNVLKFKFKMYVFRAVTSLREMGSTNLFTPTKGILALFPTVSSLRGRGQEPNFRGK